MRVVLLPFFLIRLALALTPWLLVMGWSYKTRWLPLLLLVSLTAGQVLWMHDLWVSRPTLPATDQALSLGILPAVGQLPADDLHHFTYQPATLSQQTSLLENWIVLQPHHRDLWLNLSIVYALNQQAGQSQAALSEAQQLDPNSELFIVPSPTPFF